MKGDFKRQVTDATILLQKKILKQYEDAQKLLASSKQEVITTQELIDVTLPAQKTELEQKKAQIDAKMVQFKNQQTALIDAEKEIQRQIERIIRIHTQEVEQAVGEVHRKAVVDEELET